MASVKVGDRVTVTLNGADAQVVEHISPGYVGIRFDEPQAGVNVWGQDYQATHWCIHVELLELADEPALFEVER